MHYIDLEHITIPPETIYIFQLSVDRDGVFHYTGPSSKEMCGYDSGMLAEDVALFTDLLLPKERRRVYKAFLRSARHHTSLILEFCIAHPVKETRLLQSHAVPEVHPDGSTVWYGMVWDITEERAAESEQ